MKGLFKNFILLGFSVIFCLGISEILVRVFLPQQLVVMNNREIWRFDSVLGWRLVENANTKVNTGEGPVHFVTNAGGFRIPSDQTGGTEDTGKDFKVIAIGDSFIEALQVESEQTAPQILGGLLSERLGMKVQITSDGVSDWNPNQYFAESRKSLAERKYDLGLIFFYLGNDFVDRIETSDDFVQKALRLQHDFRWPKNLSKYEIVDSFFYPLNNWFERHSQLFVFVKARAQYILSRIGLTANCFPDIFLKSEKNSKQWALAGDICENIFREFERYNTPVIFIFLPAAYQVDKQDFYTYVRNFHIPTESVDLEQPNRMLASCFREKGLPYLDPLEFLRRKADQGIQLYGRIDFHFNVAGHRALADYMNESIDDTLLRSFIKGKAK